LTSRYCGAGDWQTAMSDLVQVALIASIPPTIVALTGLIVSLRTERNLTAKVKEVHDATNGMKEELVRVTGEAEHAKGVLEGAADEKGRQA